MLLVALIDPALITVIEIQLHKLMVLCEINISKYYKVRHIVHMSRRRTDIRLFANQKHVNVLFLYSI